jgi:3-methyl-2-oxobutanoate hydroxymethyltransferase
MMTVPDLQRYKRDKKKVIVVTAYDALFTRLLEQAGIEAILVGDSLGVVVQGKPNTLAVTMEDMLYHTKLVAGTAQKSLVIGDMPFMSYQASKGRPSATRAASFRPAPMQSNWKAALRWSIGLPR